METNSKRPTLILAVGMITILVGGFLFFVYVGNNGRKTESFASRITFHSFSARVSSYYGDLKNSGASLKQRADAFMSSFWEEPAGTASAARYAEAAKRGGEDQDWSSDNGGDGDSFGKYYSKNYGGNSGSDPASWVDNSESGGASFGGGSSCEGSSGQFTASPQSAPRGKQQRTAAGPALSAAAGGKPAPALRPGFGGPAAGGSKAAAQRLYASAPARSGGQNQTLQYGGRPAAGGRSNNKLNGMSGNQAKGAGELDGATENARGDAQRSYNSKLGGGAASVAGGSGGGSIPAASGPANVSGGGAAGGSSGGGSSASASPSGSLESGQDMGYDAGAVGDEDLLQSVVTDTRNGRDARYVSPEEAAAPPEESMLKSGGVAPLETATKGTAVEDPKDFASLSPERKQEIKKNIHVFLKRIQNPKWFGAMTDIKTTSCLSTLDLCEANGISGNYLTITTEKAKLDLGVKYIKTRWRRYTIDVQRFGPSPAAQ
jgi:hypothetical protein